MVFIDFDPLGFLFFYFLGEIEIYCFLISSSPANSDRLCLFYVIDFEVKSYPDLVPCLFQRVELHILYGSLICGLHDLNGSSLGEHQIILNN